jgi:hypothetical protein
VPQIACGEENRLSIRLHGSKAGLEWYQQEPNTLIFKPAGAPWQYLRTGQRYMGDAAKASTRTPAGHPEGYLEAFANIYRGFIEDVSSQLEAAMRSSRRDFVMYVSSAAVGAGLSFGGVGTSRAYPLGWRRAFSSGPSRIRSRRTKHRRLRRSPASAIGSWNSTSCRSHPVTSRGVAPTLASSSSGAMYICNPSTIQGRSMRCMHWGCNTSSYDFRRCARLAPRIFPI